MNAVQTDLFTRVLMQDTREFACNKRVVPSLPVAPFAAHSETSRLAAESQTDANRLLDMARIYNLIKSRGDYGSTCDEAELTLGMSHQTCSARISEMADPQKGLPMQLIQSGQRRRTRTTRTAGVYICR